MHSTSGSGVDAVWLSMVALGAQEERRRAKAAVCVRQQSSTDDRRFGYR